MLQVITSILGGISLDAKTSSFVSTLLETSRFELAIGRNNVEGVTVFSPGILVVDEHPGIVFKIENNGKNFEERWECVELAAKICEEKKLDLLVLPRQSKFRHPDNSIVIAEERLPLTPNWLHQEEVYHSFANDLLETLSQLTTFIIWSGFRDVDFRNIPVLDLERLAPGSPRRIALVDVENCGTPFAGPCMDLKSTTKATLDLAFFGNSFTIAGLLQCILPTQFDSIYEAALENGVNLKKLFPKETEEARESNEAKFNKRERIKVVNSNVDLFDKFAKRITGLLSQSSDKVAAEPTTFLFRPRLRLELAARAFHWDELSGIIFANDQGKEVAFIVQVTPSLAKHVEVLDAVFGPMAEAKRTRSKEGWIIFATSLHPWHPEYLNMEFICQNYETHGPKLVTPSEP